MNYYEARQVDPNADRYDAGRWRYTCRNGERVWPVGRCRDCPGHRTREEAEAHQREFDLEHATFHVHLEKPWGRCKRCRRLTRFFFRVGPGGGQPIHLCEKHQSWSDLDAAYEGPGQVISSY